MVRILLGVVLGVVVGIILVPIAVTGWFKFGKLPVAVSDPELPFERQITSAPMHARIDREMVKTVPVQADEADLTAGAQIYKDDCAACHGFHGKQSVFAAHMFPRAPQLWVKHRNNAVVGVSDDPPGETYWKVANGLRLTGMPAFNKVLTEMQMWQVSVLLANADKPLPPAALDLVSGQEMAVPAPNSPMKKRD